jgi:hypothetical protein
LREGGPPGDPSILLGEPAAIGKAPHRAVAVRISPRTLGVAYRIDLDDDVYSDCHVEGMLDELTFLEEIDQSVIDQSVLVPLSGGSYVIWLMPFAGDERD